MYIVMFEFAVAEGAEKQFLESWPKVTQGIYQFKGSLGSRLHKNKDGRWIAYAQWPDKETYENAAAIPMSDDYEQFRKVMRGSLDLEKTKTLFEMEVEIDYLQRRPFEP